jgi:hypothetical protein
MIFVSLQDFLMSLPASSHHGRVAGVTASAGRAKVIRSGRIQGIFLAVTFFQVGVSDKRSAEYDRVGFIVCKCLGSCLVTKSAIDDLSA